MLLQTQLNAAKHYQKQSRNAGTNVKIRTFQPQSKKEQLLHPLGAEKRKYQTRRRLACRVIRTRRALYLDVTVMERREAVGGHFYLVTTVSLDLVNRQ